MPFFRRGKNRTTAQTLPVEGHPDLIWMRGAELDDAIKGLLGAVVEVFQGGAPAEDVLRALQVGFFYVSETDPKSLPEDDARLGQTAARLGYFTRAVEFERFEAARKADLDLYQLLEDELMRSDDTVSAMVQVAATLAQMEAIDPSPDDENSPSWWIPGLGGQVRGRLRDALLSGLETTPKVLRPQDLQRVWKFGFFFRCLAEAFQEPAAGRLH